MSRDQELGRDPHLEAALRHAPDADLSVPPLLRARIIAAARRGAQASREQRPWWRRIDAAWSPWRMGGAGTAAAALLAATVLWVGREERPGAPDLGPTAQVPAEQRSASPEGTAVATAPAPARPAPGVAAPAATSATHSAAAPTAPTAAPHADSRSATAVERDAQRRTQARPPPAPPSAQADRKAEATGQMAAARETTGAGADATRARAEAALTAERARQANRAEDTARPSAPAPRAPPAATPAPATPGERPTPFVDTSPAAAAPRAPPRPQPAETVDVTTAVRRDRQEGDGAVSRSHRSTAGADAPASAAAAPLTSPLAETAPSTPPPPRVQAPSARGAAPPATVASAGASGGSALAARALDLSSRSPLVEAMLALPRHSAAWRRSASGIAEAPLATSWLAELAAATRGRWMPIEARTAGAGETWTLVHEGGRQARLTWVPGAVIACEPQAGRCELARLDEAAQAVLRDGLRR